MQSCTMVTLSTTDWDAPQFGSRQQIAWRLASRGHRLLFVEVPRALHSFISDPLGTRRALRRMGHVRQIPDGPLVYTPPPVLPVYYNPAANWLNQRLLVASLRRVLSRLGWRLDVIWTYWPHSAHLISRMGASVSVYHCIDDFVAVGYPLTSPQTVARMEAAQCRLVDVIFARTEGLAAVKRQFNPNVYLLPGGVDTTHFDPAQAGEPPASIARLPRPRVGLVGTLDDRVDLELLAHCARALPGASFVLVGPVKRHRVRTTVLEQEPNLHVLPRCPHDAVPGIVATFDVCLIPYRINPYTEGLSPIKLYEYMAMGKPVVATKLPYVLREREHIRIAGGRDEFVAAVREALAEPPSREDTKGRRAVAEANSWDSQVDEIEQHLARLLASKKQATPGDRTSL